MEYYHRVFEMLKRASEESGENFAHYERARDWLIELKPDADEWMQIAALCHDIERVFRGGEGKNYFKQLKKNGVGSADVAFLRPHEEWGAYLAKGYLLALSAPKEKADYVAHLITRHEEGGDDDQNLIKDADSLSFLETQTARFISWVKTEEKRESTKSKFSYMYDRITSSTAKQLAEPLYKNALQQLDKHEF